jgi:predicted Rossmann-fold nucleotide-binding protein
MQPKTFYWDKYLDPTHSDLVTSDGVITSLNRLSPNSAEVLVFIDHISPAFVGFHIDPQAVFFNLKSTLAQLGIDGIGQSYELNPRLGTAQVKVLLRAIGKIAEEMLALLQPGSQLGRLFAADERRRVRDPEYIARMFGRSDRRGRPLLSLGGLHGSNDLILEKVDGRTVAFLTLLDGQVVYEDTIYGFLPTIAKALVSGNSMRGLLSLHQTWRPHLPRSLAQNQILLVRTLPLHIRTVYGRVVDSLLTQGSRHTTASILQPDTRASGDIYELYGEDTTRELIDIPIEFYTLEPYREYVFFSDRDQLQTCLENDEILFKAFDTAPSQDKERSAIYIVKGEQLLNLKMEDWVVREPRFHEFPGLGHGPRQALMVERFLEQQPSYPFLHSIDIGGITSEGILLTRYFPPPLMKRMLLSDQVQRCLKGLYFQYPSETHQDFFTHEDRALLHDLFKFAIPVFWVDKTSHRVLQYSERPGTDVGMFVPMDKLDTFLKATVLGIYGSNLLGGDFESELRLLLIGLLEMRKELHHPMMNPATPLALVTGGGPGAMAVGNRLAKELGILSCANVVDFRAGPGAVLNEQKQNPDIEAKMTYRLDRLVERQAEFHLNLPIFLMGGIGTDFEQSLEEVRRKVGADASTPVLLFGENSYWESKITSRFQCNLKTGTIQGSEWISNCFYCVQTAEQGLRIYREYFMGTLLIGKQGPMHREGFVPFT